MQDKLEFEEVTAALPIVEISEEVAAEAHRVLAGDECALAAALADALLSQRRGQAVTWRVIVGPRNVYAIESFHRIAFDAGIDVSFVRSASLDEKAGVFFDDYVRYRLPVPLSKRLRRKVTEWVDAGGEAMSAAVALTKPSDNRRMAPERLGAVVLVGVYGGDHIGDAGILGGVLLGLHRRFGVAHATVMSGRPEHTRRLAEGISTPVRVEVSRYRAQTVNCALRDADALVLAGGPLFGSPRILARHIASIASARRRGLPFLIERIGMGPFHSALTRWAGRRVLGAASSISMRTSGSAQHPMLEGLNAKVGRDPAFDYLVDRRELDRLPRNDVAEIEALLAGAEDSAKIGINLRPTHDRWQDLSDLSQPMVDREFLQAFADGLVGFAKRFDRRVTYVYFPMNSIQLGMSDLSAAYELRRILKGSVDLRVWESDPSLDGVVHLMRRLDVVVAMRFHGAVFALTQNAPLIGIAYFPGGRKVTELLDDIGRPENSSTVSDFTSEWLIERLTELNAKT